MAELSKTTDVSETQSTFVRRVTIPLEHCAAKTLDPTAPSTLREYAERFVAEIPELGRQWTDPCSAVDPGLLENVTCRSWEWRAPEALPALLVDLLQNSASAPIVSGAWNVWRLDGGPPTLRTAPTEPGVYHEWYGPALGAEEPMKPSARPPLATKWLRVEAETSTRSIHELTTVFDDGPDKRPSYVDVGPYRYEGSISFECWPADGGPFWKCYGRVPYYLALAETSVST